MNAIQRLDYTQAVGKLARKVALYVEFYWARLERQGGQPDTEMNRKFRGESNPPFSDEVHDLVHANRDASRLFRFHLDFFESSSKVSTDGIYFSDILKAVRYDPGVLTNWRAGETEEQRANMRSFLEVCRQVAKGALFVFPKVNPDEITVHVNPKDAAAKSPTQAAARDREARMAAQREDTRQRRLKRLRRIRKEEAEQYGHCDVSSAMILWQREMDMGRDTIRRAICGEPEEAEYLEEKGRVA